MNQCVPVVVMPRAVVLLSGGLDSATLLAIAREELFECYALSFDYGQLHRAELKAASVIAEVLRAKEHRVMEIPIGVLGGSALTDVSMPVPDEGGEGIPVTYVPARNTVFLSLALAWAEVLQAEAIFIGVNAVDYSGTTTAKLYREKSTTSSSVRLACKTAINTSKWLNEIDVKKAYHLGTYNYRVIAGSPFLSEHSFATAIDIRALDNANIIEHWNDKGDKGGKLKQAASKACKYFSNVLTPDYNADHYDHFHLDNGPGLAKFQYWVRIGACDYKK